MAACERCGAVGTIVFGVILASVAPLAAIGGVGQMPAVSPVDQVIQLTKSGLSEDLVLRAIARDKLHGDLGTSDMLTLKKAGVSDRVINAMMEAPAAADAAPAATAASALSDATTPSPVPPPPPPPPPSAADPRASLRRAAIDEFDWTTVTTAVQVIFGTNVDIGKGIRALLTKRLQEAGRIRLVERAKVDTVMKEQDFGASSRVKEDKAVVTINYRLVDAETSEVIDSGEATGESKRKSSGLGGIFGWSGGVVGGSVDMTTQNFAETIIGEAVTMATDRIAAIMNEKVPGLPRREVDIEARVAASNGNSVTITAGSNQGVEVGQQFDVFRIVSQIKDPVTGEVLDNEVEQLGVMTVASVRERVATGLYVGQPVSSKDGLVRRRLP